jgi:two-component system nitrogen regulation response regulator NtrX
MSTDILVVDDEPDIRELIAGVLEDDGHGVRTAATAETAINEVRSRTPSLVVLDVWLQGSDMDGLSVLKYLKAIDPLLPVIVISGHGNVETAVAAIRRGAYDFIEKPFKEDRLLLMVERALQTSRLARENAELRARVSEEGEPEIIGQSQAIRALQTAITRIAPTASRVLINGPNGSGKELAARVIHHKSTRRDARFVVANCARLAPERVDSELFGAESMQSNRRIVGLFEQAHKGTLYFDEICDLPLETQGKIVRAITEQRFRRVGGNAEVVVDVRVISASSRDLASKISDGSLREDLYYRLGVVPLIMPPLTERRDDIPRLAKYFAKTVARRLGRQPLKFSDEVFAAMQGYDWPGNVRQMLNTVENMLIMAPPGSNEPVSLDALPREIQNISQAGINSDMEGFWALPLRGAREEFERAYMAAQLGRFGGNISRMAVFVGMERSALHRKLKSLGVESDG